MFRTPVFPRLQRGKLIADGLVGAWPFYEGAGGTAHDLSGYGNHGTLNNMDPATDWVAGPSGHVLDFDGSNDHVLLENNPILEVKFPGTLMGWFRFRSTTGNGTIITNDNGVSSAADYSGMHLRMHNDNSFRALYGDGGGSTSSDRFTTITTATLTANQWYHGVGVFHGSQDVDIYLDGALQAVTTSGTANAVNYKGLAGTIGAADQGTSQRFDGQIYDCRIYDRALSASELALIYAGLG